MVKSLLLSSLCLFLVSCNNNTDCSTQSSTEETTEGSKASCPAPEVTPTPDPGPDHGEIPTEAMIFEVNAKLTNFDSADEEKVQKAFEIIKKVVGTREFRNRVLNFEYKGKKEFVDNEGKTNEQIYQMLIDGKEELRPELDNEMDLELQLYYASNSTVGYTYPSGLKIYMNTKFFDSYTPAEVARNVFHEWTHKLGFGHASSYSTSRDYSVPYGLGDIIEQLGKQYE